MSKREILKRVGEEAVEIINSGTYTTTNNNKIIDLTPFIKYSNENTILYTPKDNIVIPSNSSSSSNHLEVVNNNNNCETIFEICQTTTLSAAHQLFKEYNTNNNIQNNTNNTIQNNNHLKKIIALNFASAKNPGGGFLKGSSAQEESIARSSTLYSTLTLKKVQAYYRENAKDKTCLYTHHIIYSPDIVVFRNDKTNELLEDFYFCSFLSAPATNAGIAKNRILNNNKEEEEVIYGTLEERADRVLSIAYKHGYKVIVLGSWGTGVFKCEVKKVAQIFRKLLLKSEKFKNVFEKVVFAIVDEKTCNEFSSVFFNK